MNTKQKTKLNVLRRYGERCFYCARALTPAAATLDHLIPRSQKKGVPYNLRPACVNCNRAKGSLGVPEFRSHIARLFFRMVINPFWGGAL